jgi:hypothetical protein
VNPQSTRQAEHHVFVSAPTPTTLRPISPPPGQPQASPPRRARRARFPIGRAPRPYLCKRFPISTDVGDTSRWYIILMSDILLRGVPESAVGVIKQEASVRGLAPGEFITRVIQFYLLLSGPDVPPQVVAARQDSKLQSEQP